MATPYSLPGAEGNNVSNIKGRKPADSFVNFSLVRNGKPSKAGSFALDHSDPGQKQLFDLLQTPEGIELFRTKVQITCNANTPAESKSLFDLS